MQGKPMPIFGDGLQTRAFSYIDDVAPVIAVSIARLECDNHVFSVGAETPCTVLELAHKVAAAMGVKPVIQHLPQRNEVKHAYASDQRVCAVFSDLIRNVPLAVGLARMAAWAKKVGARRGKPFKDIEVQKNMPLSWTAIVCDAPNT